MEYKTGFAKTETGFGAPFFVLLCLFVAKLILNA